MKTLIVFALLSIPLIIISFRSLKKPGSHGFYRYFGWEAMLWLAIHNIRFWFTNPFSIPQIISWICLFYAFYLVIAGVILLQGKGKSHPSRQDPTLFSFEKTTELVETGLYRYIRHPLYGSLLFLSWGIFLKHMTVELLFVALFSSVMFYLTSRMDEKECIAYFGEVYRAYIKRTKMFIPFVF
jgi:protein-S-isoprenylcysteine O-methyltransferase Ste14